MYTYLYIVHNICKDPLISAAFLLGIDEQNGYCIYGYACYNEVIAIYAPMIYTAPCVMFWLRADLLRGQLGGGSTQEIETFFGPFEMASSR